MYSRILRKNAHMLLSWICLIVSIHTIL